MWSLETIKQINQKIVEKAKEGPVDAKQVYVECGIRVLSSATHKPVGYSIIDGALYHTMYPDDVLGEFDDGNFVPSRFLLELPEACHRQVDEWVRKNTPDPELGGGTHSDYYGDKY